MKNYRFNPIYIPLFIKETFTDLIKRDEGYHKISLDLGISSSEVYFDGKYVKIDGRDYDLNNILSSIQSGYIYGLMRDRIIKLALYRGGLFYKLYPISPVDAPTLEISGIRMHRVVDTKPWLDAYEKVKFLKISEGERVLDICTGLGYTAIHAFRMGGEVTSIEKDENVIEMARYNPYSRDLSKIELVIEDAYEVLPSFSSGEFDVIIHDPPRLSRAGSLYSEDFYEMMYRILRKGGRLFHYTGRVGYRRRGIDIARGVAERLRRVGFKARLIRGLMGVYAYI